MGLGSLFTRNTQYVATNLDTGASSTFTVIDNIAPDWDNGAYRGGMSIPGAWRAATLLADLLGGVPWHAYEERPDGPAVRVSPRPPLLEQPAPPDTRVTTFSSQALDLIWEGNAIGVVAARDPVGWPTAMVPVPARLVQVKRVEQWDNIPLPVGEIAYQIGNRTFSAADVIHVKGPCEPGALRGMGVLEAHLNGALALNRELQRQAAGVGASGVPTGVLNVDVPDVTQAEVTDLKGKWMQAQRTRTVAVLNSTTAWQSVGWNPSETQLLDARKFGLHELALIFGVPLSFLGVEQSSRTYTNQEQEGLNLLKFSLGGPLARFEQALTQHFPRGTFAKANLDAILRADTLTRYQAHEVGIRAGFLTDDEARELEERPPLTPEQRAQLASRRTLPASPATPESAEEA
ncbi:phage portal protein [Pseudonocardia sp. WMMC193]|uniref:phage portal protein n=1 Tax=Pseudonocardia sp. WMMC193 TaxID=2911965 RepID=UPI001F4726F4|nr:phage portal protein [Pseudonocardia sp. WMMC193]MCF7548907.1 phage portal protein [Pseudonocardia sp. WMMC193]